MALGLFATLVLAGPLHGALPWPVIEPPEGDLDGFDWGAYGDFGDDAAVSEEATGEASPDQGHPSIASTPPMPAAPQRASVHEIMTGSLRLNGAYLHYDDIPFLFPDGDDALGVVVGRMMIDHKFEHAKLEVNVFTNISRVPTSGAALGTFAAAGNTQSAYRHRYFDVPFWNDGSVSGSMGIDRLALGFDFGRVSLQVGRFPVNPSVTYFLTPNDVFAPFSATAVNTVYKPGVDGFRLSAGVGQLATVELIGTMGFTDGYKAAWSHTALLARASAVKWGVEWSAMGGKTSQRWIVGGGFQGDLGRVGIRGEGHVGFHDADGKGRKGADKNRPVYTRLAAGPSMNFEWRSLMIAAEYGFFSDGGKDPQNYIGRALRLAPDDLPYLGQHYVGATAGLELIPVLRASALAFVNAGDGSGMTGASLSYSVADEADLVAGAFVPWGKDPTVIPGAFIPVSLESEFGAAPLSVYLETRVFF